MLSHDKNRSTKQAISIGLGLFAATVGLGIALPYYLSYHEQQERQQERSLLMKDASPEIIAKCKAAGATDLSECDIWQAFEEQHFAAKAAEDAKASREAEIYFAMAFFVAFPVTIGLVLYLSAAMLRRILREEGKNIFAILTVIGAVGLAIFASLIFLLFTGLLGTPD